MSSTALLAVPAARSMIYLGMDVHKDSITIAVLPASAKTPTRLERLPNHLPNSRNGSPALHGMGRSTPAMKRAVPAMCSIAPWRNGDTPAT